MHDIAQRAADILTVLQSGALGQREQVIAVLRAHGEPEPVEITEADMNDLRQAAGQLLEVFTAASTAKAAERLSRLLAAHAQPPRLTTHDGRAGWHVHVDSRDDAPWGEWFLTSSCLALALLLSERQAPPAGMCASPSCGKPFVNTGRGITRHYCSTACGTRERVAAHRARSGWHVHCRPEKPARLHARTYGDTYYRRVAAGSSGMRNHGPFGKIKSSYPERTVAAVAITNMTRQHTKRHCPSFGLPVSINGRFSRCGGLCLVRARRRGGYRQWRE